MQANAEQQRAPAFRESKIRCAILQVEYFVDLHVMAAGEVASTITNRSLESLHEVLNEYEQCWEDLDAKARMAKQPCYQVG